MAKKTHLLLVEIFPANPFTRVFCEHYVNYKGHRLFFDFYIKELSCFVECQGQQHTKFVKHFHGEKEKFLAQKFRDNLKIDYVQKNNMYLIRINYDEIISKELVVCRISKALDSEVNFYG
jgi:very-short-patch-repair endonuclease